MALKCYYPTVSLLHRIIAEINSRECLQIYLSPFPMLLLNLGLYVYQCVKVSNQSSITLYADRDRYSGAGAEES